MNNIVIVENDEKYCFENIKEIVKQFLGEDFYNLNEEEKYKRLRLRTMRNASFNKLPLIDIKKGEKVKDIEKDQYIIYDEEAFLLSLAKNNDIVIYEKINSNIFLKNNIDKERLKKLDDNYIIINFCANSLLKNKLGI